MDGNTAFARQHRAWELFTTKGEIDSEVVSGEVARSWQRSKDAQIDPRAPVAPIRLHNDELTKLLNANRAYIEAAVPFMEFPESAVRGTGFILVLTDAAGIVLEVFGDADVIDRARANNYVAGCCRSEEEVGTNSIGLAMIEKRPFQLSGPEHYNARHHSWSCASAPVFAPSGAFLGTVTLSGKSMSAHRHTLGMVISAAEAIQNRLREQQTLMEKGRSEMLTETLLRWSNDAVVTVNAAGDVVHVNKAAETLVGSNAEMLGGKKASAIFSAPEIADIVSGRREITAFETSLLIDGQRSQFLVRPFVMRDAAGVIGSILLLGRRDQLKSLRGSASQYAARYTFANIIGNHDSIRRQIGLAEQLARMETRILITGETGTGKELMAHSIHSASARARGPFIPINCAAIPRELLEAELFGYKDGAFTGARRAGQVGKMELADGGTLFLDEVSLMPLELQAKLLRVLEDGIITRLGDSTPIRVDIRIMTATNDNLLEMSDKGTFRKDLYFRLNVAEICLPPLRKRADDIKPLSEFILGRFCQKMGREKISLSPEALALLSRYSWPGNIRELENVLEISMIVNQSGTISVDNLPQRLRDTPIASAQITASEPRKVDLALADIETDVIRKTLQDHNGNVARAARVLGISRSTIYRKLHERTPDSAAELQTCRTTDLV